MHKGTTKRYSDPLGRYFTREAVGAILVEAMGIAQPNTILDLGAGDGALTLAAAKVWSDCNFITVDIDESATCASLPTKEGPRFQHCFADALSLDLDQRLGVALGTVDGTVCNPPYIRSRWRKRFGELLEDVGLSGVMPQIQDVGADLLFLAQSLRFARDGARLGFILPDGFVAGERHAAARRALMAQHRIERVIELPRGIFQRTDAKAHVLVLEKNRPGQEFVVIEGLDAGGKRTPTSLRVPKDHAESRLDYSHYLQGGGRSLSGKLGDLLAEIKRGNISSSERKAKQYPVFHTTDFPGIGSAVPREFRLPRALATSNEGAIVASKGDILIARVGRNLEQKVAVVASGKIVLSDCVFRLKPKSGKYTELIEFLCSDAGRNQLSALSHGVSAKFITKKALLNLSL
ncbi:hypothetical protein D9X30_0577 [Cupriavidus sp. U2]|uniref:N-6 DNA methylase n=1 Tax=Cupriavidus sp. U2 TaxID=2920269 RepID=UPI001892CE29|nr:N-6 DNA methylase [Cupriavidus sp. U2]KAI3594345.1 hypothetical protein D9X30_0577 [Cupriavidus sp. U2]